MKMLKNKKFLLLAGAGIILALASFAVFATDANITWNPAYFAPASVAPNETTTVAVSFTNHGLSNINGKELSLEIRGDASSIVSATSPAFPANIKKGESVSVNISIRAPSNQTVRVVNGTLVLLKIKSDGKTKEVFGDVLPIEITLSPIPLPPNPGEVGKVTLEGIDTDGNGVRDDIDRYIVFTYPNSEKVREALKQHARAMTPFLLDAEDREMTRENNLEEDKAVDCLAHVFNNDLDSRDPAYKAILAQFLNTKERSRAYNRADGQLGGFSSDNGLASEAFERRRAACLFDVDSLLN